MVSCAFFRAPPPAVSEFVIETPIQTGILFFGPAHLQKTIGYNVIDISL
jgi:hypothetical protein